jgi:DNA-binding NarL/FixJ family response regulator
MDRRTLTERDKQILDYIAYGKTNADIAQIMGTTEATVMSWVHELLMKMNAENRTHAVAMHLAPERFSSKNSKTNP